MGHLFMIESAPLKFYNEQNVVQRTFPWQYDVAAQVTFGNSVIGFYDSTVNIKPLQSPSLSVE